MLQVIEMSHALHEKSSNYSDIVPIKFKSLAQFENNGYNLNEIHINEHVGTHFDAPRHFTADGPTVDQIPADKLCVPLAVIDIEQKAQNNPDATVDIKDIINWENTHGRLPSNCCVAMYTGWEAYIDTIKYRNADEDGAMHYPSFGPEAVEFLLKERNVAGLAVDTLSIDIGMSQTFPVHNIWLPASKWALECTANLKKMPPSGGMIFVGVPRIAGASGFQARAMGIIL